MTPNGTQRDAETLPYADAFRPDVWLDGTAQRDWAVVPFSGGPGECPARNLSLLSATHFLAALLRAYDLRQDAGGVGGVGAQCYKWRPDGSDSVESR